MGDGTFMTPSYINFLKKECKLDILPGMALECKKIKIQDKCKIRSFRYISWSLDVHVFLHLRCEKCFFEKGNWGKTNVRYQYSSFMELVWSSLHLPSIANWQGSSKYSLLEPFSFLRPVYIPISQTRVLWHLMFDIISFIAVLVWFLWSWQL